MNKCMHFLVAISILTSVVGCATTEKQTGIVDTFRTDERNYKTILKDLNGNTIMLAKVEYLGKSPDGPMPDFINDSWKSMDCDFYNIYLVNLSKQQIELTKIEYINPGSDSDINKPERIKKVVDRVGIKQMLGDYIIDPGQKLVQRNSFLARENKTSGTLKKVIYLRYNGDNYILELVQVYKRN